MAKLITVFGATGLQGGGVARHLIVGQPEIFIVRGVSRNIESVNANKLKQIGEYKFAPHKNSSFSFSILFFSFRRVTCYLGKFL